MNHHYTTTVVHDHDDHPTHILGVHGHYSYIQHTHASAVIKTRYPCMHYCCVIVVTIDCYPLQAATQVLKTADNTRYSYKSAVCI